MSNAGLIGPVIHRVYADIQVASRDRVQEIYERFGLRPGLERDFYFGLLARPMPAESLAAATIYSGVDGADEIKQGVAVIDSAGHWALTEAGRRLAAAVQGAVGEAAEELWNHGPVEIVPGFVRQWPLTFTVDVLTSNPNDAPSLVPK